MWCIPLVLLCPPTSWGLRTRQPGSMQSRGFPPHQQALRERKRHVTAGEHWVGAGWGLGMLRRAGNSEAGQRTRRRDPEACGNLGMHWKLLHSGYTQRKGLLQALQAVSGKQGAYLQPPFTSVISL